MSALEEALAAETAVPEGTGDATQHGFYGSGNDEVRRAAKDWRTSQGGPVDLGGVDKPDIATDPDQTAEDGSVTVQQAGKSYAAYQARQREEAERFDTALGIGNPDAVAEFKATAAEKMAWSEAAHQPTPEQAVQAQQ